MSSVGTALRKSGRIGMTLVMLATVITAWTAGSAMANHTPADKPFAAASTTERTGPTPRIELLAATVKNSKPADMMLLVSMECSLITETILLGSSTPGAKQSARATGTIRAWIEIDGKPVPIVSSSTPPQNPPPPGEEDNSKVTFCNRVFERTAEDREDEQDGLDYSRDYIATKSSNAFNWVRLNMGSGLHTIKLVAEITTETVSGGTTGGAATAKAYIGNRSMIGIPGKFANDAQITEGATG